MLELSIVIPAYAEARYLGGTLDAIHTYLGERGRLDTTEVIVVTADCADGTPGLARERLAAFPHAVHVEPGAKVGKGRDVRAGMLAARGAVVVFMDADLATPIHHVDDALAAIAAGADVAIGVRELERIHRDFGRRASSLAANLLVRALLLPGLADTQCGFKAFRGAIVAELFVPLAITGWGFDFEVLARARRGGYRIVELPIPDWKDPKGEQGLAGERQWLARLRTLRELVQATTAVGRQRER